MLLHLSVANYVLIEKLQIDFDSGFSVITGETGAGKSILLGALGLILGNRADKDVVMENEKKCIIEGHFDIEKRQLGAFFKKHDIDNDVVCILRREVTAAGKSRAFINDTPVKLPIMRELGLQLIDIHSQNKNQQLNNGHFRLRLIDAYSNHSDLLKDYKALFVQYKENELLIDNMRQEHLQQVNEQEYHQFLFDEIERAQVHIGEQQSLEDELELLNHAEDIKSILFENSSQLIHSEENIIDKIQYLSNKLSSIASFRTEIADLEKRLQSVFIELKDIGEDIAALEEDIHFDPSRLEIINARIDELYALVRKHRLNHSDDLIAFQNELSEKLHSVMSLDEEIAKLDSEMKVQREDLEKMALEIRKNRQEAAVQIELILLKHLRNLGMKEAQIHIDVFELDYLAEFGKDKIVLNFMANVGSKMAEISKVASGGEMSRIMLAFKYTLALKQAMPSIIFDEIDSGVSGEIADKLALLMRNMGKSMQVISISHLPQIASKANHHYLVYKENESTFTRSNIKKLNDKERLNEIAAMLSGSNIVDSAINHAKELLGS